MQTEVRLAQPGKFDLVANSLSDPPEGEARIRIRRIGICGTDIHAFHGRQPFFEYPRILGHELAAEIVALNGPSELITGDLVTVEPYLNDPNSPASQTGKTNCCESLQVLGVHIDGGMRSEINVPISKLHRAASASVDQLALVEMLCIGCHAVNRSQSNKVDNALILGAGPIGLSALSFLQTRTKNIAVADLDEGRLQFCREAFDVEHTIKVTPGESLERSLREAFGGRLPDVIFDATGNRDSMLSSFEMAAHGGRIVFIGLFQGRVEFDDPNFHKRELTLMASRNAVSAEFKEVIQAMESGQINTDPWITHRLHLDEVPERFGDVISSPKLRKAVIHLDT
ncbi:MAG: alcohol dehydrogenase [Verrucomicrobiales bacterium]|nr:alcohol dehydrogenase [Verrucomicrobiales bacterium]|tara:strand:+ start:3400 stop:4422 length:1023 start_codon:yes stop_codon:yes gene_type:complete